MGRQPRLLADILRTTMREKFSLFLIGWVGFACPVLCAIRAEAGGHEAAKASCCKHGTSESEEKSGPAAPQEEAPDRCFCSAHGVLGQKSEPLEIASVFIFALEGHAAALLLQTDVYQPLTPIPQFPPETYRVLPLLI